MVQDKLGGHRRQVEAYEKFCAELGEPPAEVAGCLASGGDRAIIGPRIVEQLEGAMRALDLKLDQGAMRRLDEIWSQAGPQAFAW